MRKVKLFLLSLIVICLSACNIFQVSKMEKECYITINSEITRTAFPEININDFNSIELYGKKENGDENFNLLKKWKSIDKVLESNILIDFGIWDFELICYVNNSLSEDGTIYSSTINKKEIKSGINQLYFKMEIKKYDVETGAGNLSLELTYNELEPVNTVTAAMFNFLDNNIDIYQSETLPIYQLDQENKAVYYQKIRVPSGIYTVKFTFYADAKKTIIINEYSVCCYIIKNKLTQQSISIDKFEDIYTINYHFNNGTLREGEEIQLNFSRKNSFSLPDYTKVTRRGYTFNGWFYNEKFEGEPVSYINESTTKDIDVYAKWTPNKYIVTLKEQNGVPISNTNLSNNTILHEYDTIDKLPILEKQGYVFAGWYKDSMCQKQSYTQIDKDEIVNNITYYALWKLKEYPIVYLNQGGTELTGTLTESTPKTHVYTKNTYLSYAINNNLNFEGWYTDPDCTQAIKYIDGAIYYDCEQITLYAKWSDCFYCYISELSDILNNITNNDPIYTFRIKDEEINGNTESQQINRILSENQTVKVNIYFTQLKDLSNILFDGLSNLITISFPKNVNFDRLIFTDDINLQDVCLPQTLTTFDDESFMNCTKLEKISIPEGITKLGNKAFYNCSALKEVTIPNSINEMGNQVFDECTSLKDISIKSTLLRKLDFFKKDLTVTIEVNIPSTMNSIKNAEFSDWASIKYVNIPDSVTEIGEQAFADCIGLQRITIPDSVSKIGNYAFYNCVLLKEVKISENVQILEDNIFNNCSGLKTIIIPDNMIEIKNHAFYKCSSLEKIVIPENIINIGSNAFFYCQDLKAIDFYSDNITFGQTVFSYSPIETVKLVGENKNWESLINYIKSEVSQTVEIIELN